MTTKEKNKCHCWKQAEQNNLSLPYWELRYFCTNCYIDYLKLDCARLTGICEWYWKIIELLKN